MVWLRASTSKAAHPVFGFIGLSDKVLVLLKPPSILMRQLFLALIAVSAVVQMPQALADSLVVEKISVENALQLNKGGPDSIGGVGDWHISNGVICAVVSDIGHEHEFSGQGGVLVDLGFCGRNDDHYSFGQDLLDGSRNTPIDAQSIRTESSDSEVSIIVAGGASGIETETKYSLNLTRPTQLNIFKKISVSNSEQANFNLISLGSFNYHSLESFVLASQSINKSLGFANIDFVTRGISAIGEAATNADTIITLSPPEANDPISYGWQLKSAMRVVDGVRTAVPRFALADEESLAFLVLADSFWLGDGSKIGWLQLPQIPFLGLDEAATLEIEEVIYVGEMASVAAITDQLFPDQTLISGNLQESNSALHIIQDNGAPFTHIRPNAEGKFSFRAPPGDYVLRHLGSAGRLQEHRLSIGKEEHQANNLSLPKPSKLLLPRGEAMRLVFVGLDGTPNPDFANRLTDFSVRDDDGEHRAEPLSQVFLAGIESDQSSVDLVAGRYLVYATRGLEFSLESTTIEIDAEEIKTLEITAPVREVQTPGRIAADLHVHAGDSFDNTFSNAERVRTFVAEHGEIMVNSEHDVVVDFAPLILAMEVDDKITSMTGAEMTSLLPTSKMPFTGGHVNFFPYHPKPLEFRNGMVAHEGRRLRDVLADVKARNPGSLAQLNHPRRNLSLSNGAPDEFEALIDNGAYLDHMGIAGHPYDPNKTLDQLPNSVMADADPISGLRDLDVDAIEVINPGGEFHNERIEAVRKDWLSFILQGERITGTANSDSHHGSEQVAVPRNMVAVSKDDINNFSRTEFLASIKSGNVYGTTGPMLEVKLGGVSMGETFKGTAAELELNVTSATWIPVDHAEIQVNGITVKILDLSSKREWYVPLEFAKDSVVTLEIYGETTQDYAKIYPQIEPYAFTNPIYVDADADGNWAPPGLNTAATITGVELTEARQ